jgi:hypothetical protein
MRRAITLFLLAFASGFIVSPGGPAGMGAARAGEVQASAPPTVIELFTSQGCSSCPPADELLNEMAGRNEVVAISWHVDYWDYIGWKDPFATSWSTGRQRGYRGKFARAYVYTPQMVIDGQHDVVGSRRGDVKRAVSASRQDAPRRIPVSLDRDAAAGELVIAFTPHRLNRDLDIWLVGYSGIHETKVSRGENRGATLRNTHIARTMHSLGTWDGAGGTLRVPVPAHEDVAGFALILQEPGQGAIRGAAKLDITS